jgi:hypothetical protein
MKCCQGSTLVPLLFTCHIRFHSHLPPSLPYSTSSFFLLSLYPCYKLLKGKRT